MSRLRLLRAPLVVLIALSALALCAAESGPSSSSPMSGNGHNLSFDGRIFLVRRGPDAPSGGWHLMVFRPERVSYGAGGVPDLDAGALTAPTLIKPYSVAQGENALAICE